MFNKLVRDRIPKIIANSQKVPVTKKLNLEEFKVALNKKLQEEVDEFIDTIEQVFDCDIFINSELCSGK
jgi:predicted house-cleaning noncanonical NTP pyrophosphatase (MazG superfamily)